MIEKLALPLLHAMDAEKAHDLSIKALSSGMLTKQAKSTNPILSLSLFGRVFPNPIGLAAGFDKNAQTMDSMLGYGFGFVEAGTVTPLPQDGNPKPRVFRDKNGKNIINRIGFPNHGVQ